MATAENKAVYRRFIEEVFNNKNVARTDECIQPDFVDHTPGFPSGLDGAKQGIVGFLTGFPDIHFAIEDQIAEGDKVVARLTMRGTHQGEFAVVPPTGKQVSVAGIDVWRVRNGKRAEHWLAMGNLGLMQQLGAIRRQDRLGHNRWRSLLHQGMPGARWRAADGVALRHRSHGRLHPPV